MIKTQAKTAKRARRHGRIRSRVTGTAERPRLSVFKSNKQVSAQLIDDITGTTLAAASSLKEKGKTLSERAAATGESLAKAAKDKKIEAVVFDRGGFAYQGVIAALADGARKGGLTF